MRTRGLGWAAGLALVLAGCGMVGLQTEPATSEAPAEGLAPEFALPDTDGTIVSLADLLAGTKPTVLVFYRGHW